MAGTWFLSHTAYERVTLALASVVLLALPHPAAVATRAIPTTRTPTVPVSTSIYPSVVASGTRHRRRPCLAVRSRSEFELMMVSMESLSSGPGAEPDRAQHDALVGERGSEHLGGADAQLVQFPPQRVEQDVGGSGETAAEHDHLRVKGEDQRRGTHGEVAHVAADRRERGTVAAAGGGEDVPCRLVRLVGSRRTTPATQVFLGANPAGRRQRADLPGRPGESAVQLAVDDQAEAGA